MTQLANALWALEQGFKVLPLCAATKDPNGLLVTHGAKDSTTSEEKVKEWWTKYPNSNVGINGGVIIDCDTGIDSLTQAEYWRTSVGLPATMAVRTGRRSSYGIQYHYTGTASSGPFELDGVSGEVRSGNLYGVAPGSIHPDTKEPYQLVIDVPRAAYPGDSPLEKAKKKNIAQLKKDPATLKAGEKIKRSHRQYWLVSQCGRLRNTGLSGQPLLAALRAITDAYCEYPEEKTDAMLEQIASSGVRNYGIKVPTGFEANRAAVVEEFNERFYVVENFGGKCRVCEEVEEWYGDQQHVALVHQSFADFAHRFMHQQIAVGEDQGGLIFETKSSIWLTDSRRRQYQRVVYLPGAASENVRNLWRGFAYRPVKGDCAKYLAHIKDNICQGKQEHYNWLMRWFAYSVRHPAEPGHTCPVFKGGQGIGKNIAAETFGKLWGPHALTITQKSHFTGHFNAHLRNCSVLVANEAFFAGDRSQAGAMKGLITDRTIAIEAKGVDVVMAPNLLHVIICSNEDWVVPADLDVRRFTVFEVGAAERENLNYFAAIDKELQEGGYGALLYHLLHEVELGDFSPRLHLPTEGLAKQKEASLTGMESVWYECLQRGNLPAKKEYLNEGQVNLNGAVHNGDGEVLIRGGNFVDWANRQHQYGWNNVRSEHVGHVLGENPRAVKPGMGFKKQKTNGVNYWLVPSLDKARKTWNKKRFVENWKSKGEDWTIGE